MAPSKLSMSLDDQEAVVSLMSSDGWPALVKLMSHIEDRYIKNVLGYNLNKGPEGLVIEKARHEGIESFISNLITQRESILGKAK